MPPVEGLAQLERQADQLSEFAIPTRAGLYPAIKRAMDWAGGVCILIAITPLLLALVILVRSDGGAAFYGQPRLGRSGRVFTLWKLRTMVPDAEAALDTYLASNPAARAEWDLTQKLRNDPRVTPVGRILRKYSLDELPQILNVIAGDMSLVGPRPMFPEQRTLYPGIPYCDLRPGMTGLWQVSDRNTCAFADRAGFDRRYAEALSLREDLWIMLRTVAVVVRGTGC